MATELDILAEELRQTFGVTLTRFSEMSSPNYLETGIGLLDYSLLGGVPEGSVIQIVGKTNAGKTTLAARIAAAAQKKYPDSEIVYVDAEGTLDRTWCRRHGLDPHRAWLAESSSGEDAVSIVERVLGESSISCVVIDSLPALIPMKISEKAAEDRTVAERARLISTLCAKILSFGTQRKQDDDSEYPCTVVFINQFRYKIGGYGDPRVLPGGQAQEYFSKIILEVKSQEIRNAKRDIVKAKNHTFVVMKGKGFVLRTGEYEMNLDPKNDYGFGTIIQGQAIARLAHNYGLLSKDGKFWKYGEFAWQKKEAIWHSIQTDRALYSDILRKCTQKERGDRDMPVLPPDRNLFGFVDFK